MHFFIEQKKFFKTLSHFQSITNKKTTIPVLNHILLEAKDNKLRLVGTDLDIVITQSVEVEVRKENTFCVPSALLFDIVKKMEEILEAVYDEESKRLVLQSNNVVFKIPILEADSFPNIDDLPFDNMFSIRVHDLKKLIDETYFCMSTDEARYQLNGIYFHPNEEGFLNCVSTDTHRLALSQVLSDDKIKNLPSVIIGRKSVFELRKILDNCNEIIKISLSEARVQFYLESENTKMTLSSRLIDGKFPQYQSVLNFTPQKEVLIDREKFEKALDRVSVITNDEMKTVELNFSDQKLIITVNNQNGFSKELIDLEKSCEDFSIKFNVYYIWEITKQMHCKNIQLLMGGSNESVLIKPHNQEDSRYIVMPLVA